MTKVLIIVTILILSPCVSSKAEDFLSVDNKGMFSGEMQNVPVIKIKSYFEQNYNIRFIGDENLFRSQLTVSFKKLNLEKTLKRIFSRMNVALIFNGNGEVTEVRLMPTNHINTDMATLNNFAKYKNEGLQEQQSLNEFQEKGILGFDAQNTELPEGNSLPADDITNFQVVRNAAPPGDQLPAGQDDTPPDAFKVIRNSPPPGDMNNADGIFQTAPGTPP